ncbi:hypothetical protein BCR35DRAFT_326776 [Leucosporidium creatinivorum]|uniref:Uncharacterized protein n=1 Tax=Leucosporidium creatinivorum TaxID=106004 RepID=A0A1Y2DMB9_9BASI|nr:hypothetical protein BCR35DRAFT_326776 [Leucosporidium creatinivorum]
MYPLNGLSKYHALPRSRTHVVVLYSDGHFTNTGRRARTGVTDEPTRRAKAYGGANPYYPELNESEKWRESYKEGIQNPQHLVNLQGLWKGRKLPRFGQSGSQWSARELQAFRVIPSINQSFGHVSGFAAEHSSDHVEVFYTIRHLLFPHPLPSNLRPKGAASPSPAAERYRLQQLRLAANPFYPFFLRLQHVRALQNLPNNLPTRWFDNQDAVDPPEQTSPRTFQVVKPFSGPAQFKRHQWDVGRVDTEFKKYRLLFATRRPRPPPREAHSTEKMKDRGSSTATDETYIWALLQAFLDPIMDECSQAGWSKLTRAGTVAAPREKQWSFQFLPRQVPFQIPIGPRKKQMKVRTITDGGICLSKAGGGAVDVRFPSVVTECKRAQRGGSKINLFAQAFGEMLGAAFQHHSIAPRISSQDPKLEQPSERMFALVLDGVSLSAMATEFPHDYLENVEVLGDLSHFIGLEVCETTKCDLGSRKGRDAAVELILRILGTLRTAPTTSLLREFFDHDDRIINLQDLAL